MKAFKTLTSKLAPLDMPNIDTDQIIPKQFLKRVERSGFGQFLFYDWRFNDDGTDNADFSLNEPKNAGAKILLTRDNFGCGSSREHAPWALEDYGFECIIAPSYADIFYNNCFQNGILPIILESEKVDNIFSLVANNAKLEAFVDLENQSIVVKELDNATELVTYKFEVDAERKNKLLNGLDDIGISLQEADAISAYEKQRIFY